MKIRTKEINVHLYVYVNGIPDTTHPKSNILRFSQYLMLNNREISYSEFLIWYSFIVLNI